MFQMKRFYPLICTAMLCGMFLMWPACYDATAKKPEQVKVQQVQNDGTLLLSDRREVVLADWVFPSLNAATRATLRARLQGADFFLKPLSTDRYGRTIACAYTKDGQAMSFLPEGMVYSEVPHALTRSLLASDDAHSFRIPQSQAGKHLYHYRAVYGKVVKVTILRDQAFLNFSPDWKKDFSVMIPRAMIRKMTPAFLQSLQGQNIVVRGYIHPYYGPRITLLNPDMIALDETKRHRT